MTLLSELPTPALLLDLDVLDRNLRRMSERTAALGVALRPHVKTHKCIEIAERQRSLGINGITVSTLYEAQSFADNGFDDITWAFPVILSRLEEARKLARRVTLRLVVDSHEALRGVKDVASDDNPLHVLLKVDCGYHRAGVDPESAQAAELADAAASSPRIIFDGLLTHSGHAYHGRGRDEIVAIAEQERKIMVDFAKRLRDRGIDVPAVSVGSTPAMSVVESLEGVTEARPGNYAFYDYMQYVLGSCGAEDCAITVLASGVSTHGDHSVVDAGALALSKDPGSEHAPRPTMGPIYADYRAGELEPEMHVEAVSQEHGIVNVPQPVGTRVRIMPNHSCLTAACFDEYHVVHGDEVVDSWKVWRGR